MVDLDGEWKWHLFRDLLPAHVLLRTVTVKPHLRSTFVDRPGWNASRVSSVASKSGGNNVCIEAHWCAPATGWCKSNTDDSRCNTTGCASCGGVFRNEKGLGGWLSHIFYEANAIADELVKMDTSGHVGGCIFWYPSPGVRDLVLHEVGLLLPICSSLVLSVVVM
ncbi:hypothetical protein V6N12_042315 [Hibiscus sabdariffa]|uniref:RNase H type-1 domain-containing protein n=1 Tax=Hibiscus sabdariffa TaxID=183260 RepID=A0ABR2EEF0_9ROSI